MHQLPLVGFQKLASANQEATRKALAERGRVMIASGTVAGQRLAIAFI